MSTNVAGNSGIRSGKVEELRRLWASSLVGGDDINFDQYTSAEIGEVITSEESPVPGDFRRVAELAREHGFQS